MENVSSSYRPSSIFHRPFYIFHFTSSIFHFLPIFTSMNQNITLRDIAKALNLSVSTVSRALTDSYQIGEKTKKIVLDYANSHHYIPNRMARGLKEGKSRSIGVVVCSLENNFVSQMLDGIDQYCTSQGYQLIIMQSKESFVQEKACVNLLYAGGVDGLLISPSYETTDFDYLKHLQLSGLPVVLFDRLSDQLDTHKVSVDNFRGAYQAITHLIENGYKSIAHINTNTTLSMAADRFKGYKKALEDAGMFYNENIVEFCDTSTADLLQQNLVTAVKKLMSLPKPPDAIFTATDQLSTRCLAVLNQLGYHIPKDVALIGFSNTDLADVLNPSLSTIYQPSYNIGNLAAKQLISLVTKDTDTYETVLLPTELHIRSSSIKIP